MFISQAINTLEPYYNNTGTLRHNHAAIITNLYGIINHSKCGRRKGAREARLVLEALLEALTCEYEIVEE